MADILYQIYPSCSNAIRLFLIQGTLNKNGLIVIVKLTQMFSYRAPARSSTTAPPTTTSFDWLSQFPLLTKTTKKTTTTTVSSLRTTSNSKSVHCNVIVMIFGIVMFVSWMYFLWHTVNKVFLSYNYWTVVHMQKFDVFFLSEGTRTQSQALLKVQ